MVESVEPADVDPTVEELVALAGEVHERLTGLGLSVSTAESCTGGLVGHLLTEIPGSSDYYVGGAISYSNAVKHVVLGVTDEALERHGAVSAQVAVAMAEGARRAFGADLAVAVTGVAGPSGGSDAKPVGLTYVAVADAKGHDVQRYHWTGGRSSNKRESARAALIQLRDRAEQHRPPEPAA